MVGFCGVAGNPEYPISEMTEKLKYLGDEKNKKFSENVLEIDFVYFKNSDEKNLSSTEDGSLIWIWGDIYGFKKSNGYSSFDEQTISDNKYCVKLYDKYGLEFISHLNGVFAGVLYQPKKQKMHFFTDRLGTHPIFYTKTEDGLVFSTQIQSLPHYPSVNTTFDLNYLSHFFTFERVLGTKTVLKGVEQIHPGSILSYDIASNEIKNEVYWTPEYKPKNRPFSRIVQDFTSVFRDVIDKKINEDRTYGLYLSGGSDSRLILAMVNELYPDLDLICYHLNERRNREARIAKKVAEMCKYEFRLLERDEEYQKRVLEETSPISIFSSFFDQSHFIGFREKISSEVDEVIHGNYSDTILDRHHLPKRGFRLPLLTETFYLPSFHYIHSFEEFIDFFSQGYGAFCRDGNIPQFLEEVDKNTIKKSLSTELQTKENSVVSHGVNYNSFEDFIRWWSFYPLTNTKSYLVYYSEIQSYKSFTPFLDNRIIDFTLSFPDRIISRKDIINSTISNINPILAKIPHGGSYISLEYSKIIHFLKKEYETAKCKLFPNQKWEGSWGNTAEVIRKTDFVKNKIKGKENLIRRCDFLDLEKVKECYSEHIDGRNNTNQLLALLTFIENPITNSLIK